MSIKLVLHALETKVGCTARKMVFVKLCDNANDDGECWPSLATIAKHCEMSRRSAIRHIAKLAEDGFIERVHRADKRGDLTSNFYRISVPWVVTACHHPSDKLSPPSDSVSPPPSDKLSPPFLNLSVSDPVNESEEITCAIAENQATAPRTPSKPVPAQGSYPPEFEKTWQAYPRRVGGNSKVLAFKAWQARVKSGVPAEELHAGVLRYAKFVQASGKAGSEYVKQAATFFGPAEHWRESFDLANGAERPDWMRTAI